MTRQGCVNSQEVERLSTQNEILQKQLVRFPDDKELIYQANQEIRSHELWPLQEVGAVPFTGLTVQGASDKDDPYVSLIVMDGITHYQALLDTAFK